MFGPCQKTMNANTANPSTAAAPAAWIGWDWADQHHDLFLETAAGQTETLRLANRPEELHAWLQALGRRFAPGTVVLCLEASRSALLPIFLEYSFLELYLINPKSMARFREVVRPSGSKSDALDSRLACQLVKSHRELLHRFVAQDPLTQELAQMVRVRRELVQQRTTTANQLKAVLKLYYPLALELLQDDTTTALAACLVLKFPTLRALQEAPRHQVRRFFRGQGCRLTEGLEQRLASIAAATGVTQQAHWNNPNSFLACSLAQMLKAVTARIEEAEEQISILAQQHPNRALAQSVPGAAAALEPRLMTVLGTHPEACASAQQMAVRDGVAPRRIQSGNSCLISRRLAKPQFDHQTWIEFAKCSTLECQWARQFVEAKTKAGKTYYTAIRALAYKWIRILCACWKKGIIYEEARYLKALQQHQSPYQAPTGAST
jgi:transposase